MKTAAKVLLVSAVMSMMMNCSGEKNTLNVSFNPTGKDQRVVEIKNIESSKAIRALIANDFVAKQNELEIPSQLYTDPITSTTSLLIYPDPTGKGTISIEAGSSKSNFAPLAYAELWKKEGGEFVERKYIGGNFVKTDSIRVPDECTDHSFYIKYEGPGWESNLVGYRFYLDWRNANDIFAKRTEKMVLTNVGQDGYDSYHNLSDWGMDVLKVGNALGLGTIAYWNGTSAERVAKTDSLICKIVAEGPLRAAIQTDYYGWQTNDFKTHFTSWLTIDGNSRLTKQTLQFDQSPANVCTGLNRDTTCEFIKIEKGEWVAIATFGKQSLNKDNLGMVVIAEKKSVAEHQTDELNYVIVLKPENNMASWYFGAAWELDKDGYKTADEFKSYIEQQLELLNNPDKVE